MKPRQRHRDDVHQRVILEDGVDPPPRRIPELVAINLPGSIHGLEVVRQLREEPGVVTIAVSGNRAALEAAQQLGVQTFQKPVDPALLLQIVRP